MAISNTSIIIKRSLTTGVPTSAKQAELAYSYASNTLFIGTTGGNGVVNVGGQYYTSTIDSATSSNVSSTLVKRNASGAFSGNLFGNSNTATTLLNGRNFNIGGGDITSNYVGFDGSSSVTLNASLNNISGLSAGVYGGTSQIPVVQVAANGRIMSISNTLISTSFNISDGSSSVLFNGGSTFIQLGTNGITTTVSQNTVTFSTDNTILRSNTTTVGPQVINTDLAITGNLSVFGNTTTVHVNEYKIDDPIIYLAANNYYSDIVDIGFAANYFDGTWERHTGFFRDATTKSYYLFDNYLPELSGNNNIDRANTSFRIASLTANVINANISSSEIYNSTFRNGSISDLTSAISISDGGTNNNIFDNNTLIFYNGSSIVSLANLSSYDSQGSASYVPVISTDAFGRVTSIANTQIGDLTVSQGGTGATSFAPAGILIGNGTDALQTLANTGTAGIYGSASYVPVVTTDEYGRVSNVSNTAISIDQSQVSSGIFPINRGGTNNDTFTNNTLTLYNGSSIVSLPNVSFSVTGVSGSSNTLSSITVDNFGRVSAATFTPISGLTVSQGGTGFASATSNGLLFGNGTGSLQVTAAAGVSDQTWSNQIMTVTNAGVPIWSSALDGGTF